MRKLRISLASTTIILISIGVVMIFSSSGIYALQQLGDSFYFLNRHLAFLLLGTIGTIVIMSIDYRDLQKWAKPLLVIGLVLLVLVLIPGIGKESSGARRWFRLGPYNFQPSEFMKLIMIIYTADFLARKKSQIAEFWRGFVPIMMVVGVSCVLILKQPDLGSSVFIALVVMTMIFVAGARLLYLGVLIFSAVPVIYLLIARVAYRLARIMAFLDPWEDSRGIGFQLSQSQIAIGSGGIFGTGLGHGMQKLYYLPAAHTDFIFSIIGEETGLVGTLIVIALFVFFIWQGARIAKRITDPFGYYLSVGIVAMIGLQAMINIGVSIGALPTKGLPLPFISYGGSALIFHMMSVGLLLNISRIQDL